MMHDGRRHVHGCCRTAALQLLLVQKWHDQPHPAHLRVEGDGVYPSALESRHWNKLAVIISWDQQVCAVTGSTQYQVYVVAGTDAVYTPVTAAHRWMDAATVP
jgi:hypothetical protein